MNKKVSKTYDIKDYIKLLPFALILLIVPTIVYMKTVKIDPTVAKYWTGSDQMVDFFSYYKMVWLIALTSISVITSLYYVSIKKVKISFSKIHIPLGFYLLFVFLSSSFSSFHNTAFFGFPDRYEGFFTIFCYIFICLLCSLLVSSKFDIKYIFSFLIISVLIVSIIGFSQFFAFDLIQTNIGRHIILPKANYKLADTLHFNFPKNFIYSTLYNPNYVGSFFAMIFPFTLVLFITCKSVKNKVLSGLFSILAFINLLGSLSTTGYISALIACLIAFLFLRKDIKRNMLPLISFVLAIITVSFIMNFASGGTIQRELGFADTKQQNVDTNKTSNTTTTLTDLKVEKDKVSLFVSDKEALLLKFNKSTSELFFSDIAGKDLKMNTEKKDDSYILTFDDPRFSIFKLSVKNNLITVEAPNSTFNVMYSGNSFKVVSPSGQLTDMINAESFGFKGKELWGSSRGYIWSRSIPLIKDTILLGHGPDTFAMYFPQNDYSGKLKYVHGVLTIVDKPHNMYLQMAINTGVLSLISFLLFVGWYCINCLILYFKGRYNDFYIPGVACFIGVLAYLIAAFANDSTVSVSPVFWAILGIGIACNRMYSQQLSVSKK